MNDSPYPGSLYKALAGLGQEILSLERKQDVIVVNGDPVLLEVLFHFISFLCLPCRVASDNAKAIELMERQPATILILTDIPIVQKGGMELIRTVKKRWPDTDIIVMTGQWKGFSYTDLINAGVSDFIQKPFNFNEFEAKLKRVIREQNLRAMLKSLSIRDALTGLYNRGFFEQKLEEEAQRAYRQGYLLYLVMVDIDDFKRVNDIYGHQEGDRILKGLANILLNSTRKHVDSACRYGGDEFTVIIPNSELDKAQLIAERIRKNYLKIDTRDTTLSIGISQFKRTNKKLRDDINFFIHQADKAMYKAKELGGNRIVVSGQ